MKTTKKDGFSSVFIVMILSSLMALLAIVITASLDRAADSIADTVTANAGSSVLTECNKDLHDQFGVLAIKNNPNHLSNLANYYISESIDGISRFVHLELNAAIVDIDPQNDLYVNDFRKQIAELGLKSLIFKKNNSIGLTDFYGSSLPSYTHGGYSGVSASSVLSALDFRTSVGMGFGITQYVMNTFTHDEIEYLIFGHGNVSSNENSTRNLIFAIRCIIDCVEQIEDPILFLEAIARAWEETEEIISNPSELERYLKAMVYVMSGGTKLAYRIMDIMQMTIDRGFTFEDYAYGFELSAQFSRGRKTGLVTQTHRYTN